MQRKKELKLKHTEIFKMVKIILCAVLIIVVVYLRLKGVLKGDDEFGM